MELEMGKGAQSCEICGSTTLIEAFDMGHQALCDDLIPIGSRETNKTYPLKILGCETCYSFVQSYHVKKEILFPESYHYRAALTKDVLNGMAELVGQVETYLDGLTDKTVLDIGCNDGSLLSFFKQRGAVTHGIEPTHAALDADAKTDWIYKGYFDASAVETYLANHPKPDIITFTNVFAHIENLPELLDNLGKLLGDDTKLVIENHYMGAVSEHRQFDTFYHEHPRTYSAKAFQIIAEKLSRYVEAVVFPKRYNGNIRVIIGNKKGLRDWLTDEKPMFEALVNFQPEMKKACSRVQEKLRSLAAKYGPLPGKAFPGRAAVNIHLFGITRDIVDCTYEQSKSPKIGHYVPGTRIEIRDENEFFEFRMDSPVMINFAWHIHAEIENYMRGRGYQGELVKAWIE
ncbi:MAG: class I SAM-dependent methyltransferase [Parvibaculales bacterium]